MGNMKRDRPYGGQVHTDTGLRGMTEIEGITFRDLRDCFIRGLLRAASHVVPEKYEEACKGEDADLDSNDVYYFNLNKLDPMAIFNNVSCEVEKLMGIYPNILGMAKKE